MSKIIDTHCHYNLNPLYKNWQEHWNKAQQNGVGTSIIVGTNAKSSKKAIDISKTDKNLFATIGIHPIDKSIYSEDSQNSITEIISLLKSNKEEKQIVAIGEIGLDYYHLKDDEHKHKKIEQQKQVFISQIKLAELHGLPIVLHIRDKNASPKKEKNNAYWDSLEILEKHYNFKKPIVMHCVSGSLSYALHALDIGAYFGFDGNITYPNSQNLRELLALTPFNRILLETDAPYLPPQEFRGKSCEPWMISKTADYVTSQFHISLKEIEENTNDFFDFT